MSDSDGRYRLAVVGAGKMGSAIISALIDRGILAAEQIIAAEVRPQAREAVAAKYPGLSTVSDAAEAARDADVLLIAVKPQDFAQALSPVAGSRRYDQLVVSIMAGVPISTIAGLLGEATPVIRAMPNVCCEVAEGAFGYAANANVSAEQRELVHNWFNGIGAGEELPEELLDGVTGLSGSGPAFVATFIEALADGGVAAGLPRKVAERLAAQTVLGAGRWVLENSEGGPSELKDAVCSPGGTTIAGIRALEAGGLRSAAMEAVLAAAERSKQLGE